MNATTTFTADVPTKQQPAAEASATPDDRERQARPVIKLLDSTKTQRSDSPLFKPIPTAVAPKSDAMQIFGTVT